MHILEKSIRLQVVVVLVCAYTRCLFSATYTELCHDGTTNSPQVKGPISDS